MSVSERAMAVCFGEVGTWCNAVCFGEVGTRCNSKYLPPKAMSRGFKSRNLPLHKKLNVKLFSMTSSKLLKKWEFCATDSTFFTKGEMEGEKTYALPESFVMNEGEGPNSYAKNSTYQVFLII